MSEVTGDILCTVIAVDDRSSTFPIRTGRRELVAQRACCEETLRHAQNEDLRSRLQLGRKIRIADEVDAQLLAEQGVVSAPVNCDNPRRRVAHPSFGWVLPRWMRPHSPP